jgi:hypothetical protein
MLTQGSLTQKKITQKRLTQFSPYFNRQMTFFNPLFWYEADYVEKDLSGAVSILYDKSRNGFHLVQATQVNKPLLIENYQNGQPALRFDGLNDFMRVAFGQTFAQPNTIYVIWNRSSSGTDGNAVFDGINSTQRNYLFAQNNLIYNFAGTLGAGYVRTPPIPTIITKSIYNSSSSQLYENGILKISENIGTQALSGISLGCRHDTSFFLNGHILALLGFNRLLSFSEDLNVMNYLNQKYGVF